MQVRGCEGGSKHVKQPQRQCAHCSLQATRGMPPPAPLLHVATAAAAVPTCRRYRQSLLFGPLDLKAAAAARRAVTVYARGGASNAARAVSTAQGYAASRTTLLRRHVGAPTQCAECAACRLGTTRGAVARCDSGGILHGCGCRSNCRTWNQRRGRRSQCHSGWRVYSS